MKTVFSSHSECAHIWASQSQYEGRASRVFFESGVIYSYGRHFPVARFAPEFGDIVLFTNRGYSSSTGKHKGVIRAAIPSKYAVIYCDDVTRNADHNLKIWENAAARLRRDFDEKTHKMTRGNLAVEINMQTSAAAAYCDALKIARPSWLLATIPEEKAREYISEALIKRHEKAAIRRAEYEKAAALDASERLTLWQAGENVPQNNFNYCDTLLRIKGEQIQTSRGANIPVADALALWPLLLRAKRTGNKLEAGLHSINLGAYRFNSFDGITLIVGCHSIAWAQIEKMAIQLNLTEKAA